MKNEKHVNVAIEQLKQALRALIGEWEKDGCVPPNYVRKRGTGEVVAEVNRWCGGYQNSHEPVTIGWKCQVGSRVGRGVLLVSNFETLDQAIEQAKVEADKALKPLL